MKLDNTTIREAVNLWFEDQNACIESFGHISNWDTSEVTRMTSLFNNRDSFNEDISRWNVSRVTGMSEMFWYAESFNQNIGSWNVCSVTEMDYMFTSAKSFNQHIGDWNLGSVTNMSSMFFNAKSFNQDIGNWDVSNVTNMNNMFTSAKSFNQNIGSWDVSNVIDMEGMFSSAETFNQDIGSWNVSKVRKMSDMFRNANSFNQNISNWNISKVTNLNYMFYSAKSFNQDISAWNVSKMKNMICVFTQAKDFNQDISSWNISNMIYLDVNGITIKTKSGIDGRIYELNGEEYYVVYDQYELANIIKSGDFPLNRIVTSRVTTMLGLFEGMKDFNEDISNWDTSNVKSMSEMFSGCTSFNQPIGNWNTKNVTSMISMFNNAKSFNQPIGNWDTNKLENISNMFENAESFNQPIENWDVSRINNMLSTFKGAINFNQSLSNWKIGKHRNPNMFSLFENAKSFNGDVSNWKLSGYLTKFFYGAESFNQSLESWDVSEVSSVKSLFEGAKSFNKDISKWNTSNFYTTENMFYGASDFNSDISKWNISSVKNMKNMFREASSFNQDIGGWDVSKVEEMSGLFQDATSFNQDISNWKLNSKLKKSRIMFLNAKSFNEEKFSPFTSDINKGVAVKTKKNEIGIELSSEEKNAISKIKKFLNERDFDKIDFGLELLISLNNVKLFETLLHGCKIELTYSYGELTNKLKRNEFFTGTGPAQPYLNYVLFCIIAHVPEEAEIDKSIVRKNMTSLDLKVFFSEYDLPNKFLPIDRFSKLSKLKIDFNIFKVNYNVVDKKLNRDDWFVNNKITDLELLNTSGSLKWFKNFSHLKSLKFGFGYYGYPIENIESFEYLDNLEELYLENINEYKQVYNNIDFLKKCKKIKKFHLKIKDCYSIENIDVIKNFSELEELYINGISSELNLEALLSCEKLNNISLRSNHKIDLDYKLFKNCASLETLKLYGFKPIDIYGRISEIGGLKGLVNLNKISFGSFNFIGINNGSLMTESNTKINKPTSINEDNQCVKDQDIVDNDIIMNHADSLYVAVMPELSSEDKKALSEIKKLLTTRDYDKIDVGIEKLISLNNVKLFETLLYGCKIELTQTNFYGNQMTNKLRRNEFFTGTGPAQPYLNYALFCIIANVPEGAGIDKSLVQKNMTSLDLKVFFLDYDLPNKFLPIDKFSVLSTLKIDFTIFTEMNKGVNKNLIRDDWFVNNNIIELELSKTSGSLKWFKNFTQLKSLKFWFGYYPIENIENFEYLENLEELYLYTINQYEQIYKNVDFLNKCNRIKKFHLVNKSLENIDVIKNFHELEELNISEIRSELNLEALLSCEKLKKLSIKARNFDFELIKNCAALETLNLSDGVECNLSGKIIDINQLKGLNNLKHLTIDNVEIKGIDNKIFF